MKTKKLQVAESDVKLVDYQRIVFVRVEMFKMNDRISAAA